MFKGALRREEKKRNPFSRQLQHMRTIIFNRNLWSAGLDHLSTSTTTYVGLLFMRLSRILQPNLIISFSSSLVVIVLWTLLRKGDTMSWQTKELSRDLWRTWVIKKGLFKKNQKKTRQQKESYKPWSNIYHHISTKLGLRAHKKCRTSTFFFVLDCEFLESRLERIIIMTRFLRLSVRPQRDWIRLARPLEALKALWWGSRLPFWSRSEEKKIK